MLTFWGITGPKSVQYTLKRAAAVSRGIPRICRGEPRNFANGAAEFGKICRGKLWALLIRLIDLPVTFVRRLTGSAINN